MIVDLLQRLEATGLATLIREDPLIFPWIEAVHVMAIALVLGSILIVDLRLMGLASKDYPAPALLKTVLPLTWAAFAGAAVSGALMFTSQPVTYYGNFPFRMKMLLLLGAGLNMAVFHLVTQRRDDWKNQGAIPPVGARLAGAVSMLLWLGVVSFGRWIGFTIGFF